MSRIATALLLVALTGLVAFSTESGVAAPTNHRVMDDHEALEKSMKAMKGATRRLRKSLADATKKEKSLEQIAKLQQALLDAKPLSPEISEEGEKKTAALLRYRKLMIDCLAQSLKLERAVLDGKNEEAMKLLKELHGIQDIGHKEFKD